jgi:hypothetical protein
MPHIIIVVIVIVIVKTRKKSHPNPSISRHCYNNTYIPIGSYSLLPQVPNSSQITTPSSWMSSNIIAIVPPHREAFKRTIAIIGYLNLRLVHEWKWTKWTFTSLQQILPQFFTQYEYERDQQGLVLNENWSFALALFLYTNYHFFPIRLDYKNGNTFVFVLPMFIGFNIDAIRQFPTLVYDNEYNSSISSSSSSTTTTTRILNRNVNVNWDDVHRWNEKVIDETYLLLTLLCTLQIAFMFTVAFRGKMSIKTCYWVSAIEVALLFIRLFN